jgi:hypothetical protein
MRFANIVSLGNYLQGHAGFPCFPYGNYYIGSYFRSSTWRWTALSKRILLIFRICSQKQMIWPDTRRIVTMMTNKKSFRYWSEMQQPRSPVRSNHNKSIKAPNSSISLSRAIAYPEPTFICFVHILPKSFQQWFISTMTGIPLIAFLATKLAGRMSGRSELAAAF